jgi:hypothetical protein
METTGIKQANKKMESAFIQYFSKAYSGFPSGTIHAYEKPDFVVNSRPSKIGIEVTKLFKGKNKGWASHQAQQKIQNNVLEAAEKIFKEKSSENYSVFASFHENSRIDPKKVEALANWLTDKILEAGKTGNPSRDDPVELSSYDLRPHETDFFLVLIYDFGDHQTRWAVQNVFSVEPLNESNLIEALSSKEIKAAKYRTCNELWLVIVIDYWDSSSEQYILEENIKKFESTRYDKIFLFRTGYNDVRPIFLKK